MAKQKTAVSKRKKDKAQLQGLRKLYNSMNKEAKRQHLPVSKLAFEIAAGRSCGFRLLHPKKARSRLLSFPNKGKKLSWRSWGRMNFVAKVAWPANRVA